MEDPILDARDAQPCWHPAPPSCVRLAPEGETRGECAFSLWGCTGRKSIVHDGEQLHVTIHRDRPPLRAVLDRRIDEAQPFSFVIPAGTRLQARMKAASRFLAMMTSRSHRASRPPGRPSRTALFHARALQALDGSSAGASRREIAQVLFGAERVAQSWQPGSDLRSHVRHLVHRATALVNGGYRQLLDL